QYPRANEKVLTGRLRLVRTGIHLEFQVDEGAGFRTIATKEVGGADVVSVRAFATSGEMPLPVDLRFTNLDLRWDPGTKIASGDRPAAPQRSRGWRGGGGIGAAVVVLAVAGVVLAVRRRGADQGPPHEPSPAPLACPGCQRKVKVKAEQ